MDATRLKRIPVFSDLDDDALEQVAALAAEVSVPSGKELVREGDYSYDVLVIEEGTASVERGGEHPRLFFRKADVPELRKRAATPEGSSPDRSRSTSAWTAATSWDA